MKRIRAVRRRARLIESATPLSPREREVAVLAADGRTNRQIAEELVVTEAKHPENIPNKLGFSSRGQITS